MGKPPRSAEWNKRLALAVVIPAVAGGFAAWRLVAHYPDYGIAVFLGVPFMVGFLCRMILGPRADGLGFPAVFGYASMSLALMSFGFLIVAFEGIICLAMAAPMAFASAALGILVAGLFKANSGDVKAWVGLALVGGGSALDRALGQPIVASYASYVDVDASPDSVWREVVGLDELPPPTDWVLRSGIACPQKTEIKGTGVGAQRHCTLSTGPMPEVVTAWEPSRRLGFVPLSTPPMMKELNPFGDSNPPHLHGYYKVLYGEFFLQKLSSNRTRLYRVTRYEHLFRPGQYWTPITDLVADRAHSHVLDHVKRQSERRAVARR